MKKIAFLVLSLLSTNLFASVLTMKTIPDNPISDSNIRIEVKQQTEGGCPYNSTSGNGGLLRAPILENNTVRLFVRIDNQVCGDPSPPPYSIFYVYDIGNLNEGNYNIELYMLFNENQIPDFGDTSMVLSQLNFNVATPRVVTSLSKTALLSLLALFFLLSYFHLRKQQKLMY